MIPIISSAITPRLLAVSIGLNIAMFICITAIGENIAAVRSELAEARALTAVVEGRVAAVKAAGTVLQARSVEAEKVEVVVAKAVAAKTQVVRKARDDFVARTECEQVEEILRAYPPITD